MVLESPSGVLRLIDDAHLRHVTDVGFTGLGMGRGDKYLLVPPGYKGVLHQDSCYIIRTKKLTTIEGGLSIYRTSAFFLLRLMGSCLIVRRHLHLPQSVPLTTLNFFGYVG